MTELPPKRGLGSDLLAIPLAAPIPKAQYADIWHRMNVHLFGEKNDPQTKDASRKPTASW